MIRADWIQDLNGLLLAAQDDPLEVFSGDEAEEVMNLLMDVLDIVEGDDKDDGTEMLVG